jgi:RND family efflux transporter MFP subunit
LARAEADITRWRSEHQRLSQLATSGAINRQLVDETFQKLSAAEASLNESKAAIEAAKAAALQSAAEAANAAADVVAANASIRVADADILEAKAMQSYLTIHAPFDGVVTSRQVDPGHFVQPAAAGTAPLLVIARIDRVRVFVAVPEMEATYVNIGDPAVIEVQSLRGAEYEGEITRTSFALDPNSRSLDTIIDIKNPEGQLRPGLFATVTIRLHQQKDALTLPTAAVVRQGKDAFCYLLKNGKAAKTPIQIGTKVGDDLEVVRGLSETDVVILNKASALKDGQPVTELKPTGK